MNQRVVLCVDDDLNDLEIQRAMLESAGYRVYAVEDARTGLAIFMMNNVDLVLMDFHFPATDGGIIAAEMRRRKPHVPIALISGYPDAARSVSRHVDAVLAKSMDPTSILPVLSRLLRRSDLASNTA